MLLLINANLAKRKTTFLQDIPFNSICFALNTSKCAILQKRKRLFCKIFHLLVYDLLLIQANAKSCKKAKRKRLFYKIFHLLVYVSLLILVNAQSCKKENDFFCKIFHLLVHVSLLILVNAKSCKKENDFFARYSIY